MLTLATNANSWDGPGWVLLLIWITAFLSFISALGVAATGWFVHGIRERLQRGDDQFKELNQEQATLAVDAAMRNGEVQKLMYKDFVTRQEFDKHTTRMAAFETETLKGITSVGVKLDLLLKREEVTRG